MIRYRRVLKSYLRRRGKTLKRRNFTSRNGKFFAEFCINEKGTNCFYFDVSLETRIVSWTKNAAPVQGCQMVCFQTKDPNLGKFWRVLHWKTLVYIVDTWPILRSLIIFYEQFYQTGNLVLFVVIWYIFSRFGILYQEKSGNPAPVESDTLNRAASFLCKMLMKGANFWYTLCDDGIYIFTRWAARRRRRIRI
jgi:hypothetical protein